MPIGATDTEHMTPMQRAVHDRIASGPRGGVPRPFLAMLDSPGLAEAVQGVGEAIRFKGALGDRHREVAILAAAAAFGSGYEWRYHNAIAADIGMSVAERQGVLDGSGQSLSPADAAIVAYVYAAIRDRSAMRDHLEKLVSLIGREAATEVTIIAGYYPLLALCLNAAGLDEPLPDMI